MRKVKTSYPAPDTLICLVKDRNDFSILKDQLWYRIPIEKFRFKIKEFENLAFYLPSGYGEESYTIRYYGKITRISTVMRKNLFPSEPQNPKSVRKYYKILIDQIKELRNPIHSRLPRKIVFIPTTLKKLFLASEINDIFHTSPLEDKLWEEFKHNGIVAERQFSVNAERKHYMLDFALFCRNSYIDVECNGDKWHITKSKTILDNKRDNSLAKMGWRVLRFSTQQLENIKECCKLIKQTIKSSGGQLPDEEISRLLEEESYSRYYYTQT